MWAVGRAERAGGRWPTDPAGRGADGGRNGLNPRARVSGACGAFLRFRRPPAASTPRAASRNRRIERRGISCRWGLGLEHFPTNLARRDGADFGPARGERRELCLPIETDDQRGDGPKAARPFGVASGSPSDCVAPLARATGPHCAALLAEKLPDAITVCQIGRKVL